MKKISFLSVLAVLSIPAFAEEAFSPVADEVVAKDVIVEQSESKIAEESAIDNVADDFKEPEVKIEESNPKIRFPHGLQFGIGVSPTSGLNGFIGYNNKHFDSFWAKRFGVRFDFASYSPIKSKLNKRMNDYIGDEGIEISDEMNAENLSINAKHYGVLVDFYPFGDTWFLGGLRLSGGYMAGKLDLDADIQGEPKDGKLEFDLNHNKYYYNNEKRAHADINWKYNGPYAGAGFDLGLFLGLKMYFDAGVVFTGNTAKINLDVPTDGLHYRDGTLVKDNDAKFKADYNKEKNNAQDKIKDYPYYPIIKLGFMYRF